jgi:pimeloyl-ACP methyl ester carboxylesterase
MAFATDPARTLPASEATVAGRRIRYFEAGPSSAAVPRRTDTPVVVLLTGAGDTVSSWLPVQTRLARRARVLAYDRSGMGGSSGSGSDRLDDLVAELEGFIDAAAPGSSCVLVGHSFGGLLARVFAQRFPHRVAGLVLLDATPDRLAESAVLRRGFGLFVLLGALVRALAPVGLVRALFRLGASPLYPDQRHFESMLDDGARRSWRSEVEREVRGGMVPELKSVLPVSREARRELAVSSFPAVPVTLVTSSTYPAVWIRLHEEIARRYARSRHLLTGDRSHYIHMRNVDLTVEAVEDVLAAVDAAEAH